MERRNGTRHPIVSCLEHKGDSVSSFSSLELLKCFLFHVLRRMAQWRHKKKGKRWLHNEIYTSEKTGLLKDTIIFTDRKTGNHGKGPVAVKHGITHFIEDSLPVLQSIYDYTRASMRKDPKALFYFPRSGLLHNEIEADEEKNAQPACFKQVHSWEDVLDRMNLTG